MAFNYTDDEFVSFAEYADVVQRDARLFESNEGLTEQVVVQALTASSQKILAKIRASDWWREYTLSRDSSLNNDVRNVPVVDPDKIDYRHQEFIDLNVYSALAEYLLPKVADFGNETSAEVVKIGFYRDAATVQFKELLEAGDWYDFSGDGNITVDEKKPTRLNLVRVR
jgi:hypothetical protein